MTKGTNKQSFNCRDDHGFSPLHWAAKEGHSKIVEMLLIRGARVTATNRGDDTPLHLAAAHGHRDILHMVQIFCNNGINMKVICLIYSY